MRRSVGFAPTPTSVRESAPVFAEPAPAARPFAAEPAPAEPERVESRAPESRLHLAVTDAALGYWRWAPISDDPLTFAPDLGFNEGLPVTADFASATSPTGAISFAQGIELDDRRPVVIGSRTWRIDNGAGVFDTDYAIMRVHASETVLRDGFEED